MRAIWRWKTWMSQPFFKSYPNRGLNKMADILHIITVTTYIMGAMASQITGVSIVYSTVCSAADQREHQSFASLAFVRGILQWPVNFQHKGQWRWKCSIWWLYHVTLTNISLNAYSILIQISLKLIPKGENDNYQYWLRKRLGTVSQKVLSKKQYCKNGT